jgi:hypothetical protein
LSEFKEIEQGFFNTLSALGGSLSKIIVVGGWCPYLYAGYLWQKNIPNIPTTTDIDLGVLETGVTRFSRTVYDQLKSAGFDIERIYEQEENPIEFVYKKGVVELKIEFITSFETSDDTLNRFLSPKLACNRIEAFELLLENPISLNVKHGRNMSNVFVPDPACFLFHKGVTFVMRSDELKRDKDLFYVYFILKFCPDRRALFESLARFKDHEFFPFFRKNLTEYLSDVSKPGYLMLRPFIAGAISDRDINLEIKNVFGELLQL